MISLFNGKKYIINHTLTIFRPEPEKSAPTDFTLLQSDLSRYTIWEQFGMTHCCSRNLMFPWQPFFFRHIFLNLGLTWSFLNEIFLTFWQNILASYYCFWLLFSPLIQYYPPRFIVVAWILVELQGRGRKPPPVAKHKKQPGLNRVKVLPVHRINVVFKSYTQSTS